MIIGRTGRHVLAIMDTTDVLFPTREANKRGFGAGSDGKHPGLFRHPVLAVDAANGGVTLNPAVEVALLVESPAAYRHERRS